VGNDDERPEAVVPAEFNLAASGFQALAHVSQSQRHRIELR